jgi:magnesium chelatase family protein
MIAKVYTIALLGLEGKVVEVEVDISPGLFNFSIVGLAGKAIQESKERVASAIKNSNFTFPAKRITVNLAPADLLKTGPFYDLPIAIGILIASGQININEVETTIIWGELALDGCTRSTKGALVAVDGVKALGFKNIFLPTDNALESSIIKGINIFPVKTLTELTDHYIHKPIIKLKSTKIDYSNEIISDYDMANIKGQYQAKRALEIAAAGAHNVIFTGTPGAGKTFMAKTFTSILPSMQFEECVEVTKIHSISGFLDGKELIKTRPFRSPHHTSSQVSLIGGGSIPRPGEVSLSHRGVLFLDEFNEFPSKTIEVLRQPLEDKVVSIARASSVMIFPANFILIAAMNPCKCGFFGDDKKECICTTLEINKYTRKISGPIMDRIDIQLHIPRVKKEDLFGKEIGESSAEIKQRVERARTYQLQKFKVHKFTNVFANADLTVPQLKKSISINSNGAKLIKNAVEKLNLTARSYFRTLRVAKTIADLESKEIIDENHIAEALSFRLEDTNK